MADLGDSSRRNFLAQCFTGDAALGAGAAFDSALGAAAEPIAVGAKSRVVVARDPQLRGSGSAVDQGRILALLDRAMVALFEHSAEATQEKILAAWRRIAGANDTVGLKVNTLGGRGISTNVELVIAVCERLQQAGVKPSRIIVWDRESDEMERAGFHIAVGGNRVQCYGTDRAGYEEELSAWGSVGGRLSKLLTHSSVLINLPVLKDHDGAGVTLALKNMYGAIHNPNKYHPNGCNPYVADLNMLSEIRSRMKLVVCDATTAMYEGGPGFKPERSWRANSLLVAQDPVAHDATGWRLIERKRAEMGFKTLEAEGRAPHYISTAADREHRLGHNEPDRIAVVEV
jgi:uncharacterized protein (DUF362 family)